MVDEYNYKPTVLNTMINRCENEYEVINVVKRLINSSKPSYGFTKLLELNALHLSLEAIILEKEWQSLFTDEERAKARNSLV